MHMKVLTHYFPLEQCDTLARVKHIEQVSYFSVKLELSILSKCQIFQSARAKLLEQVLGLELASVIFLSYHINAPMVCTVKISLKQLVIVRVIS